MQQYHDLGHYILAHGVRKNDRTGKGTISLFGYQTRYNLQEGFPLVTTKDMSGIRFNGIIEELLWFIRGGTNIGDLVDKGVNIWNRDAYRMYTERVKEPLPYEEFVQNIKTDEGFRRTFGDLGPIYGKQWRAWVDAKGRTIDQLKKLIHGLEHNPDSRRHILLAWNVGDLDEMGLPPCHALFQCYVHEGVISGHLYQRSADYFLGVPYNIASYAAFLEMLAHCLGYQVGELIHSFGDVHIYTDHITLVQEQLSRTPLPLPTLALNPFNKDLFAFTAEDFYLGDYQCYEAIKGEQSY